MSDSKKTAKLPPNVFVAPSREARKNLPRPPYVFDANGIRWVSGLYPWARQENSIRRELLRHWAPQLGLDRWHTGLDLVAYNLAIDAMIWNATLLPSEDGRGVRFDRAELQRCFLAGMTPVWSC